MLFRSIPIFVDVGQLLRIIFQLQVTLNPSSSVSRPNAVTNGTGGALSWPIAPSTNTNGSESIQNVAQYFNNGGYSITTITNINQAGDSIGFAPLEPGTSGQGCYFWLSANSHSLQSFNNAVVRSEDYTSNSTTTSDAYVNGTYTLRKTAVFSISQQNGYGQIHSMGIGQGYNAPNIYDPAGNQYQAFAFVFEQSQSKFTSQTLTLAFAWSWDRSFVA